MKGFYSRLADLIVSPNRNRTLPKPSPLKEKGIVYPFGLRNIGNTCFMNSSLQCFFSLPSFIQNLDIIISDSNNPKLLKEIQALIQKKNTNSLKIIKSLIAQKNELFYGYNQQDSFEFCLTFIELLSDENYKYISDLFLGKMESILKCTKCNKEVISSQYFSSINLSINESRRIFYIPFSLSKSIICMPRPPKVGENIKIQNQHSYRVKIGNYLLLSKKEKCFECVSQVSPEYDRIYAFELPDEIHQECGLTVVQLKTLDKIPITFPFLCEVPLGNITEKKLKGIIIDRIHEVLFQTFDTKTSNSKLNEQVYECLENLIHFSKKQNISSFHISEKSPICSEHVNIYVENIFNFGKRKQLVQETRISFDELFNSCVRLSQIDPGCKWHCDYCGEDCAAYQRCRYSELPKILIFQIKRSQIGQYRSILDRTKISIPSKISITDDENYNIININKYKEKGLKYNLRAISHHDGCSDFGHYWTWGKRDKSWYIFNDNSFSKLDENPSKPTGSSYIAFYQRVSDDQEQSEEEDHEIVEEEDNDDITKYSSHNFDKNCIFTHTDQQSKGTNYLQNYFNLYNYYFA